MPTIWGEGCAWWTSGMTVSMQAASFDSVMWAFHINPFILYFIIIIVIIPCPFILCIVLLNSRPTGIYILLLNSPPHTTGVERGGDSFVTDLIVSQLQLGLKPWQQTTDFLLLNPSNLKIWALFQAVWCLDFSSVYTKPPKSPPLCHY